MREKHVFKRGEVAHAWVHKKIENGRCGSTNMHFNGDRFYSYGTVIAERLAYAGRRAYLVGDRTYSSTTSGHQGEVRSAIPNTELVLRVTGADFGGTITPWYSILTDGVKARAFGRDEITASLAKAAKAQLTASRARSERRKGWALRDASEWLENAQKIKAFFGIRGKFNADVQKLAAELEANRIAVAKAEKERQRLAEIENREVQEKWLAGESVVYPYDLRQYGTRLRVVEIRDSDGPGYVRVVQTSLGINIPYDEARLAFTWLMSKRAKGWVTNGEQFKIAGYNVSSVSETGVIAGCHRVTWAEIERIAKAEAWL